MIFPAINRHLVQGFPSQSCLTVYPIVFPMKSPSKVPIMSHIKSHYMKKKKNMKVPPFLTVKSTTSPQPWPGGCSHLLVEVADVCRARPACRPRISIPKLPISTSIHLSYLILFYSLFYSLIYCNLFSNLISNQFYFLFYSPYLSPYAISIHTYLIHET